MKELDCRSVKRKYFITLDNYPYIEKDNFTIFVSQGELYNEYFTCVGMTRRPYKTEDCGYHRKYIEKSLV